MMSVTSEPSQVPYISMQLLKNNRNNPNNQSSALELHNAGVIAVSAKSKTNDDPSVPGVLSDVSRNAALFNNKELPKVSNKTSLQDVSPTLPTKFVPTRAPEKPYPVVSKKRCVRFSLTQIEILTTKFETSRYLTGCEAEQLAKEAVLSKKQVFAWFSARRRKTGTTHELALLTSEQDSVLRENYVHNQILTDEKARMLALKTGLSTKQVNIWFVMEMNRIRKKEIKNQALQNTKASSSTLALV